MALTGAAVLPALDATVYARHPLHAEDRVWVEKNCYVDIWIELLHALGLDPTAVMPFLVALDFLDDQWTFFKPPHGDLFDLYGVEVEELNVWRPLAEHVAEHLARGRFVSTEADAFYLPDTAGTDYRTQHTKTTIVAQAFDPEHRRLGYFHNAGYFTLEGEDFDRLFPVAAPPDGDRLPLYAELVIVARLVSRSPEELKARSRALLRRHLARRPVDNPVHRFATRFDQDLPRVTEAGLAFYHAWAFATVRQLGAAFELLAAHLRWLDDPALAEAAPAFDRVSAAAKVLILKAARAVNGRRPLDGKALFDEMASAWQSGMDTLSERA